MAETGNSVPDHDAFGEMLAANGPANADPQQFERWLALQEARERRVLALAQYKLASSLSSEEQRHRMKTNAMCLLFGEPVEVAPGRSADEVARDRDFANELRLLLNNLKGCFVNKRREKELWQQVVDLMVEGETELDLSKRAAKTASYRR